MPGEPMSVYHRELDQEDFLVISGEAVTGRRRPGTAAARVGLRALPAEHEPRDRRRRAWTVRGHRRRGAPTIDRAGLDRLRRADDAAARHGASVAEDTMDSGVVVYGPAAGPRANRVPRGLASRVAVPLPWNTWEQDCG